MTVTLLVDEDNPAVQQVWEARLRKRMALVADVLARECGLKIEIASVGTWDSADSISDFTAALAEFEAEVDPGEARLVIGYSSQPYKNAAAVSPCGACSRPLARHLLLPEPSSRVSVEQAADALLHAIGHWLGAVHSPEADSAMRPTGVNKAGWNRIGFDPVNALAMAMVAEELSTRDVARLRDLSWTTRARLWEIYSTLAVSLPEEAPRIDEVKKLLLRSTPATGPPATSATGSIPVAGGRTSTPPEAGLPTTSRLVGVSPSGGNSHPPAEPGIPTAASSSQPLRVASRTARSWPDPDLSKTAPPAQAKFTRENAWSGRGEWIKVDLHCHTRYSDGTHTIAEIVAQAAEQGCSAVAITDHADRDLQAATPEYFREIRSARNAFRNVIVLAGLEWNIPPYGGREHVVVLVPPDEREERVLTEFKTRFDDKDREPHDPALAADALKWLAESYIDSTEKPVLLWEHSSRKRDEADTLVADLLRCRQVNGLLVGFSGAPGHQGMQKLGAYEGAILPIDRWDPAAAELGGAWDQLLAREVDVWAALAPSDFHAADAEFQDYWPGQFSETWLRVPERSAGGIFEALRGGSFFANHGGIAREVELTVGAAGLSRAAHAGEAIEVVEHSQVEARLHFNVPLHDWVKTPNRIDEVELIAITPEQTYVVARRAPTGAPLALRETLRVPPGGVVLRARGRRMFEPGPDLMFYTNPIRIGARRAGPSESAAMPGDPADEASGGQMERTIGRVLAASGLGSGACLLLVLLTLAAIRKRMPFEAAPMDRSSHARDPAPRRGHYLALALAFTAFAVYGSLVPLRYVPLDWDEAIERFKNIPFLDLGIQSRSDWVANILLFVPIGFCWLAALSVDCRLAWRLTWAPAVVIGCSALSFAVEFAQLWFPQRTVSQNDIVAENLGGAIGVALWLIAGERFTRWCRYYLMTRDRRQQWDWLLQAYLLGLLIYSAAPLDLTTSPAEILEKYREGKILLAPFTSLGAGPSALGALLVDLLLAVPVGMFAATALRGRAGRRPFLHSCLLGSGIVLGIELLQVVVYTRFADTTDLVTGVAGVAVGARLATWLPRLSLDPARIPRWIWPFLLVVYAGALLVLFWSPFRLLSASGDLVSRWNGFFAAPLSNLYWGSEYNAATQVLRKGLWFAPLGVLSAFWLHSAANSGWPFRLLAGVLLLGIALWGMFIETGQLWLMQSTPSFTDVLLYLAGAALALVVTSRFEPGATETRPPAIVPEVIYLPDLSGRSGTPQEPGETPAPSAALRFAQRALWVAATLAIGAAGALVWMKSPWRIAPPPAPPRIEHANTRFTALPLDPLRTPQLARIPVPEFPGGYAIWGATGRDHRGHIWFGVSAQGVQIPSAHLFEFVPETNQVIDRGDVVSQLQRNRVYRIGEGQMKIHSKIYQAPDGYLYFASMDEQGEEEGGSRLPNWGSHLWRLHPEGDRWEHLFAAPEGLIAVAGSGKHVYALGYFDHVLYQYDTQTGRSRSIHVGSLGGHISRNFFCDHRGHVYVPRLKKGEDEDEVITSLVELNDRLEQVEETQLWDYLPLGDLLSHGIVGFQPMEDDAILFCTHVGGLFRVVPRDDEFPATIQRLGWFHPRGPAYVASMFTYSGERFLVGATHGSPASWIVHDLVSGTATESPLAESAGLANLLLYGSVTRDNAGNFYLVGAYSSGRGSAPIVFKAQPPP